LPPKQMPPALPVAGRAGPPAIPMATPVAPPALPAAVRTAPPVTSNPFGFNNNGFADIDHPDSLVDLSPSRRRPRGPWWKGPLGFLVLLGIAGGVTTVFWPQIKEKIDELEKSTASRKDDDKKDSSHVVASREKDDDPTKKLDPKKDPPKTDPPKTDPPKTD